MACAGLAQIRTVDSMAAPAGWPTSWARLPIPRTENPTTQAGSASASRTPLQMVFLNGRSHQGFLQDGAIFTPIFEGSRSWSARRQRTTLFWAGAVRLKMKPNRPEARKPLIEVRAVRSYIGQGERSS